MEPEGSLPCLQKPAPGPYPDPRDSSQQPDTEFVSYFISDSKVFIQVRDCMWHILISYSFMLWEFLAPRSTPKMEGHVLAAVREYFVQHILSWAHICQILIWINCYKTIKFTSLQVCKSKYETNFCPSKELCNGSVCLTGIAGHTDRNKMRIPFTTATGRCLLECSCMGSTELKIIPRLEASVAQ